MIQNSVSFATLSTQDNIKLLKKLENGFIRKINMSKYLHEATNHAQNRDLDFLIDSNFQGVNRLFILSFKDDDGCESHKQHYLPTVEVKDYTVMINGRHFFNQIIRSYF